jgi:hypothetical protein
MIYLPHSFIIGIGIILEGSGMDLRRVYLFEASSLPESQYIQEGAVLKKIQGVFNLYTKGL